LLATTNPAHADAEASITPPEVRDALAGAVGSSVRVDGATGVTTLFTAHTVQADGAVVGILRLGFPSTALATTQRALRRMLLIATSLATLAIVSVMVFQAERAARTVRQLTDVAERITGGELGARIISYSSGEIGQLARAFNRMASNLENLLRKSEQETDRLNTVMYAMNDGVLIVNKLGKVELINRGATRLLNTAEANALNQSFVQVVRDHRIVEVWQRSKTSAGQESDIVEGNNSRSLQIVVTPLLRGADRGHLVIMHDLTRIRQLQTIRQDFVSNVSHELRTPLAALRALVETLRDGALEDPPAAQRFLDRMESEVDALTQMVQELLELSRIESGQAPLRLQAVTVAETLRPGVERLRMQAERANIHLSLDLPPGLPQVVVDVDRVQQVVTNLVHNAIKFTPPDGYITVSAAADTPEMVTVAVRDSGVGIPSQDLNASSERFFKADRARPAAAPGWAWPSPHHPRARRRNLGGERARQGQLLLLHAASESRQRIDSPWGRWPRRTDDLLTCPGVNAWGYPTTPAEPGSSPPTNASADGARRRSPAGSPSGDGCGEPTMSRRLRPGVNARGR
ncbi:MAG: histidine kinase dimerization/phospho-acceptor domain-containing protein, partial [Caldilineaceae bacterium]